MGLFPGWFLAFRGERQWRDEPLRDDFSSYLLCDPYIDSFQSDSNNHGRPVTQGLAGRGWRDKRLSIGVPYFNLDGFSMNCRPLCPCTDRGALSVLGG
jgi:hypothetical protein